jgi:rhodanese-related sulfurtransferase
MSIKQLSADDFEELINNGKVHLLDVRESYEFKQGFIGSARLVPSTRFREEFEKLKIKKKDKVALYCRSGSRSDFLAKQLQDWGYENLFNLEMGIIEWLDYGKKIIKE